MIRQTTVGEADKLAPLEHHYLGRFAQAAGSGRRRGTTCHTAYNQDPFHQQDSG
jgi:hypothetical protein